MKVKAYLHAFENDHVKVEQGGRAWLVGIKGYTSLSDIEKSLDDFKAIRNYINNMEIDLDELD
jgi:hypothetical protein